MAGRSPEFMRAISLKAVEARAAMSDEERDLWNARRARAARIAKCKHLRVSQTGHCYQCGVRV